MLEISKGPDTMPSFWMLNPPTRVGVCRKLTSKTFAKISPNLSALQHSKSEIQISDLENCYYINGAKFRIRNAKSQILNPKYNCPTYRIATEWWQNPKSKPKVCILDFARITTGQFGDEASMAQGLTLGVGKNQTFFFTPLQRGKQKFVKTMAFCGVL